jgi:hypothetical protein
MNEFLMGGIAVASFVAGLFFFRFWVHTRDRFFVFFALSFWIEAANRVAMIHYLEPSEDSPLHYLVRLVAYGLILFAIIQKNRSPR